MSAVLDRINALAAKAVEKGVDMTKATVFTGGDYEPPVEGPTRLRFVGYVEIGKQKTTFQGVTKFKDQAILTFELSGPKHPPVVSEDGTKNPIRISITETISLNDKANFFKLFQRMNYAGKAQHIAQLLGEAYKGKVIHRKYKRADGTEGTSAELKSKDTGYTIEPPRYEVVTEEDGPTGEFKPLKVDPPLTTLKCFLWAHADMDQWASIFIDGTYAERKDEKTGAVTAPAKSKNTIQNKIKLASNFGGSPIHQLLVAGGLPLDLPDAEVPGDEGNVDGDDQSPETTVARSTTSTTTSRSEVKTPVGAAAEDALNGIV